MQKMIFEGFPPVYDGESRLLILGSFPSVKSREVGFYYGNPQNRFWKTVCAFFGEDTARDVAEKKAFLLRRRIALWDVVTACNIAGSSDASIQNAEIADLPVLLRAAPIRRILCNGKTAYALFCANFPTYTAVCLPSTSPANPRFTAEAWENALSEAFPEAGNFRSGLDKGGALR